MLVDTLHRGCRLSSRIRGLKSAARPGEFGTSATGLRKSGWQDGSFQGNGAIFLLFFPSAAFAPVLKCRLGAARQWGGGGGGGCIASLGPAAHVPDEQKWVLVLFLVGL